jgi:tetratricopeptide (TPR) repeat protein
MARDVFISYQHSDQALADRACAALERQNISCWMAPRDISPGKAWATCIVEGIQRCHTFVLLLSSNCVQSKQIARELELADAGSLRIIALRVEDVQPPPDLLYFLANVQWMDGFAAEGSTEQFDTALARLAGVVTTLDAYPAVKTAVRHRPLAPCAVPFMTDTQTLRIPPPQPFSIRGQRRLLGVVAVGLLTVGIGTGAYRGVKRNAATEAYAQGQKLVAMRNPLGAIDEYSAAIRRDGSYYDAYCQRAEVYESLGKRREAQRDLQRAMSIHPRWAFALDLQKQFAESAMGKNHDNR